MFIACVLVAGWMLLGGKPTEVAKEVFWHGSVLGVEACVKIKATELVQETHTRNACARKHEQELMPWSLDLSGHAGVGPEGLSGNVTSSSPDRLVTEVTFVVLTFDSKGEESEYLLPARMWLAPGEKADFSAEFKRRLKNEIPKDWCDENREGQDLKSCKTWGIRSAKGLKM